MKLGNLNLSDIKLGTQQVKKVIFGNNLVWQSISYIIQEFKTRVFAIQGEFEAETCLDAQLTDLDNKGLLDSASFIVTPNGYEENILFAVKPDKVGTNLLLHSQDWTNAVWAKGGATIVSSTRVAPDGTSTGTELSDVGASSTPGVPIQDFITTSTTVTFSIYTKSVSLPTNGRRRFLLRNNTTATDFDILSFNYSSTGNLGNGWFSENVGNGWFRLSYTRITGISVGNALRIYYGRTDTAPVGATDVWQVWGAQVDVSSTLNEYIPTTSVRIINGTIGDLGVTRETLGTRVNADGDIEQVPYNLLSQSQNLENALWIKRQVTIGQNVITAPDETMTADNVVANSGVTYSYIGSLGVNVASNSFATFLGTRTASVYLKYNGLNRIRFQYGSATTFLRDIYVQVDLQTGTITGTKFVDLGITYAENAFIEDAGDGWYRVGFTLITPTSATNNRLGVALGDTTKTIANGIDGVYVWGAQLVVGTQAKDYFPTTNRFNIPRIDYSNGSCPSILVEQATSNQIRNNTMTGAVVGNPGSLPTNWTQSLVGLTREVVGLGIEKGIEYIDIRISGTASGTTLQRIIFEPSTQIVAANGQTWTLSSYLKSIAAPQPPSQYRLVMHECDSSGVFVTVGAQTITPTTSFARYSFTRTLAGGATVARVQPILEFIVVLGQTYDFTIRVYGPQMEQLPFATSLIQTSTAAVTRNADVIDNSNMSTLIGQTEGAMYIDFNYQRFNPLADSFIATISNDTTNNHLIFAVLSTDNAAAILRISGTNVIFISIPAASFTFGRKKIVISYKSGETNLYVNGVKIGSTITTAFSFPVTINKFNLGSSGANGGLSNTTINSAALYKTTLTDAQAIQLTTL